MPCLAANASARVRSRAATATTSASGDVRAAFTIAAGVMRAAPRTPMRTGLMPRHCRTRPTRPAVRRRSGRLRLGAVHVAQETQQERPLEVSHADELETGSCGSVVLDGVADLAAHLDAGPSVGAQREVELDAV